jgi:hypothetical protein
LVDDGRKQQQRSGVLHAVCEITNRLWKSELHTYMFTL